MARVVVRRSGKITVNAGKLADVAAVAAVGAIVNRMQNGVGVNDGKMRVYSIAYLAELRRLGEDTRVDHRRTGQMLAQVREISRAEVDGVVTLKIGVSPGGNRNLIAAYLQRLRAWFGLSPKDRDRVARAIAKAKAITKKQPPKGPRTLG